MKKFINLLFVTILLLLSLFSFVACNNDNNNNDNNSDIIHVESISIIGADNAIKGIQEQYSVVITPNNATDKTVQWDIEQGTANINNNGILLPLNEGIIILKATADGKSTTKQITVTTPLPPDEQPNLLDISFNGFEKIDETTFSTKVSNSSEYLNIARLVTTKYEWKLTTDIQCKDEIPSKVASPLNIGDNVFYVLVTYNKDVTLYTLQIRRKPIYDVFFNTNGGTDIETQHIEEDDFASLPIEPTKIGYEFVAWDKNINDPIVSDTIFNSLWQAKTYTITYLSNYELGNSQKQEVEFNSNVVMKEENTFFRTAYNFKIWNTKADGTGTNYCAGYVFENFNLPKNIELYAIWEPIDYSITYNLDGGTHNNISTYNIESSTITLTDATKIGYSFEGWYSDNEFKNQIVCINSGSYGNLDIYAKYSANKYIVTLNAPHSDLNQHTIEFTYNQHYELPIPTIDGEWIFVGWDIPTTGIWTWTDKTIINADLIPYYTFVLSTDGKSYEIHSYNARKSEIVIPDTHNGLPVSTIRSSAFGGRAFLTKVVIPSSVRIIEKDAFSYCANLTTLILPSTVSVVQIAAFRGCNSPIIWDYNPSISGKDYLADYVSKVNLPNDLTEIGDFAFNKFTNLKDISIPPTVTRIGEYAFQACKNLTNIEIPQGVTSISTGTFALCEKLTEIIIPNSVTEIGEFAFNLYGNLSMVFYKGENIEELNKIKIGLYNEHILNAQILFYSTSPIYDGQHWYYDVDNLTPKIWLQ